VLFLVIFYFIFVNWPIFHKFLCSWLGQVPKSKLFRIVVVIVTF